MLPSIYGKKTRYVFLDNDLLIKNLKVRAHKKGITATIAKLINKYGKEFKRKFKVKVDNNKFSGNVHQALSVIIQHYWKSILKSMLPKSFGKVFSKGKDLLKNAVDSLKNKLKFGKEKERKRTLNILRDPK